jgi:hypothetical protein
MSLQVLDQQQYGVGLANHPALAAGICFERCDEACVGSDLVVWNGTPAVANAVDHHPTGRPIDAVDAPAKFGGVRCGHRLERQRRRRGRVLAIARCLDEGEQGAGGRVGRGERH